MDAGAGCDEVGGEFCDDECLGEWEIEAEALNDDGDTKAVSSAGCHE